MSNIPRKIVKNDDEWRAQLTAEQYRICRGKGTEPPFTGKYNKHYEPGQYRCSCCGALLFESTHKFDSGSGWPSFWQVNDPRFIAEHSDVTYGMVRTEITCAQCDAHLGHVFPDGPEPSGMRYCVNSVSLDFEPEKGDDSK